MCLSNFLGLDVVVSCLFPGLVVMTSVLCKVSCVKILVNVCFGSMWVRQTIIICGILLRSLALIRGLVAL